jgi:DNA-binding transcriptional LysR family regulator
MPTTRNVLTPEALAMMDAIARTGSFAAAARELGKVPSALTYSVRQLEDALDVLLFDRRSRQAQLTPAGTELLNEGRRLLAQIDAVANRVRRVGSGWETQLTIAHDDVLSRTTLFELCEAFYSLRPWAPGGATPDPAPGTGSSAHDAASGPGTRLRLRTEVLAGTWEALLAGEADLAIGVGQDGAVPPDIAIEPLGELSFVFAVAPHHPLAAGSDPIGDAELMRHRAVAVADSAQRIHRMTFNLLPGQEVLTVSSLQDKIEAQLRCLGCGFIPEPLARPHIEAGHLVVRPLNREPHVARLGYAWRCVIGPKGQRMELGRALQWWLAQLAVPATRKALLDRAGARLRQR